MSKDTADGNTLPSDINNNSNSEGDSSSSSVSGSSSGVGEIAVETDQDVLSLPSAGALARHLGLWMPARLSPKTELALKRAVVSCLDLLEESATASVSVGGVQSPVAAAGALGQGETSLPIQIETYSYYLELNFQHC